MTLSSEPVGSIKSITFLHARPSFHSNTREVGVMIGLLSYLQYKNTLILPFDCLKQPS
jgi:hypothetical protein